MALLLPVQQAAHSTYGDYVYDAIDLQDDNDDGEITMIGYNNDDFDTGDDVNGDFYVHFDTRMT